MRRERVRARVLDANASVEETEAAAEVVADESEDLLRMMFSCCHPALTDDGRTALILRLVCGFGTGEVACAFLVDRAAMEKRIVRAKRVIADEGRLFEVSTREQARERMPAVLTAIYLMFDAGYHGSVVPEPVRADLCADAIRLASLLAGAPATATAEVDALLALMCLHAARMPARIDAAGALVPFERQDRSLWDAELIARGMKHLGDSARGAEVSTYHLEAGIAAVHAMSPSVHATPWGAIADLYDRLYALKPTPVVALGRAIAQAQIDGPARGIEALLAIPGRERLEDYPFYWAALGDLSLRAGDRARAVEWFRRGTKAARNEAERAMFARRILECVD
jgi:RNA polymerase sigma-70 factor (ECF subfamily)